MSFLIKNKCSRLNFEGWAFFFILKVAFVNLNFEVNIIEDSNDH